MNREEKIARISKNSPLIRKVNGVFQIDPNDWQDVEFWYGNKPEHSRLVTFNEDYIEKVAKEKGLNLIDAVEYVWKEKYEYDKE